MVILRATAISVSLALWCLMGARLACADDQVPSPWNGMDIGKPSPAGAASADGGAFTLTGGGKLSNTGDQFHFVYQSLTGDGTLTARVTAQGSLTDAESAGLMARQALAATSDFDAVALKASKVILSSCRKPLNPFSISAVDASNSVIWLKLRKVGETVRTYMAPDQAGSPGAWRTIDSEPIASGMIYVGLWQAGQSPDSKATFDHITLTTGSQPPFDNGTYTIMPADAPGMSLVADGDAVKLAPATGAASQTWHLVNQSGGFYALYPTADPSTVLTVPGAKSDPGTRVANVHDTQQNTQRWTITPNENDTYGLEPQFNPGIGLDDFGGNATPNAVIDIWTDNKDDVHLQWNITPTP